jgi:hypothetical protein
MPNPNDPFNVEYLRKMLEGQRWPTAKEVDRNVDAVLEALPGVWRVIHENPYYRPQPFMTREECEQRSTMQFTDADVIIAHGLGVDLTR